ncbi:hypothetical protein J5069_03445 [Candidatus Symbiopectobacterium sp. NZEC127]|nr:RecE family exodeoxyribonuclease [Candidatus Symbiopectobacterium sp. NZEC127]MCW2484947.1 hypothetical protein [Candidatus Symbiopectobacterium sp. NZEC127]
MNTYAFLIKARAKSDKKSLFCWLSAKSYLRAERDIANIIEDAEIEIGRGADYNLPIRTDWFVVDDLPEEGKLDDTWCDRYELNDDGKSWRHIPKAGAASVNIQEDHAATTEQSNSEVTIKNATLATSCTGSSPSRWQTCDRNTL